EAEMMIPQHGAGIVQARGRVSVFSTALFEQGLVNSPVARVARKRARLALLLVEVKATLARAGERSELGEIARKTLGFDVREREFPHARRIDPLRGIGAAQ